MSNHSGSMLDISPPCPLVAETLMLYPIDPYSVTCVDSNGCCPGVALMPQLKKPLRKPRQPAQK